MDKNYAKISNETKKNLSCSHSLHFFEETIPVSQRQLSVIKILYELSQHLTQLEATQHSHVEVQTRRTDHLIGGDE